MTDLSGDGGRPAARILLVDDDVHTRRINALALRAAGFEIHEAIDGPEALRLSAALRPDLVVMDVALPGMTGIEAMCRMKLDLAPRPPLVLVLTARAMRDDAEAALAAGCDGYLAKPIDPMVLVDEVGRLLSARESGG